MLNITPAKNGPWTFKLIRTLVALFSPKMEVVGAENLPDRPVVIVGNHAQMYGPIACELYLKENVYTWCAGQMMNLKEVPAYAFEDFWSRKPRWIRWFYRVLSVVIAPISVLIFNSARTVAVYRDKRILSTFRDTIAKLQDGNSVVIFPEFEQPHNNIVYQFQDRFIDLAKIYFRRAGEELEFVPMYVAPRLGKLYFGEPIRFSAEAPIEEERARICTQLMRSITDMARRLPAHTVVPYRNIPKRQYPTNRTEEVGV